MSIQPPTRKEVENQLKRWFRQHSKKTYKTVLEQILIALKQFKDLEGRDYIHLIITREDIEGEKLKTDESIIDKTVQKSRELFDKKKEPNYKIADMEDIIAVTLACPYFSDAQKVVDLLSKYLRKQGFACVRPIPKKHPSMTKDDGYVATHITVYSNKDNLKDFKCEIQIKTLLHLGWAAKTHDLIYKGTKIGEQYWEDTRHLSELLSQVDEYSKTLEYKINRKRREEQEFKEAIMARELPRIVSEYTKRMNPDKKEKITQILKLLEVTRPNFDEACEKANSFATEERENIVLACLCILLTLIALKAETTKYRNKPLALAEELLDRAGDTNDKIGVHGLIGYIQYCFGNFAAAKEEAGEALSLADGIEDENMLSWTKNNFAYFVAEYIHSQKYMTREKLTDSEVIELSEKAKRLAKESLEWAKTKRIKEIKERNSETFAFVKIVLGDLPDEVQEGLKINQGLLSTMTNDDPPLGFVRRTARIGHERLAEFYGRQFIEKE